uniref:Peptidase metallopeptidase domain-containing protein n=1 Tax=Kalanchoe fedtschenkoi TaxID=63787 RepID=A0A7N0ZZN9_KALFE
MHTHYYKPVKSFGHLAESRKGDNLAGVRDIKDYLRRFGYLDHPQDKILDDVFDNSLEQALLTFQDFYRLNKTGFLDIETLSLMSRPRCGNPDIVRDINAINQTDYHLHRFQPHYVFFPGEPKWRQKEIYVVIRENVPPELVNAISQAFSDWEPFVPLSFKKNVNPGGGARPDIRVGFFKGDHGDGSPFDGPNNALAHASSGPGDIMHFDAQENWRVGAVPGAYDIGTLARHEIGHLLGLAHSPDKNTLMYAYTGTGETKSIGDDEKAGVRDLYYWHKH